MNLSSDLFLKKIQSREPSAITYLVEQYHEALIKGAIKQGLGLDQAEVVVQNTWGTFFESIEKFEGRSHIRTYLFGIMYNKAKETFRENKKYTHHFEDSEMESIFNEDGSYMQLPKDPSEWLQNNEFMQILQEEIFKLPETQRLAFTLKEIEGESTEEICNILEVSNTNLGVLIFRAKNTLRIALEKRLNT